MLWSKTFIPTLKETPQEAESISHQLMLKAGLVRMLMAGVYSYLPLGLRVLNNIEKIIRAEMEAAGAAELLLPALQPKELWVKSGRDTVIADVMIEFIDRRGRHICLGPTHEEVITELVKSYVSSYRQLPMVLYQIQAKFRDEIRPRFGLVRSCEFIMKDAYSFDKDQQGLDKNYQAMHQAYKRIFSRCGLDFLTVAADSGVMGGSVSHEFMVGASDGEDIVLLCPQCKQAKPFKDETKLTCPECGIILQKTNTLEVGHIFQLGTKYSAALGANFVDDKGKQQPVIMGCYGIGVSRLIAAIIEQNHDKDGIIWPAEISPYQVSIIALDVTDELIFKKALEIYEKLKAEGIEVLLDDRDERAGVKFKDADLLGISTQIVIGREFSKTGAIELKMRRDNNKITGKAEEILGKLKEVLHG
ncbi:MAG: proline--tRNA ligase [Candidatus Omnitrophica bacterium]|jgi:prolyl-tRNA synthetase|nr:proline--tRNA ligase [Candidatus Omnitrophota bacterium]